MKNISKFALILLMSASFVGCSSTPDIDAPEQEEVAPVEVIYNEAAEAMAEENYILAHDKYAEVERLYPYSKWATQAGLMTAYASYKNARYDEAIIELDRFIDLHPGNDSIAYARYLKALSFYDQITGVQRDQFMTQEALKTLDAVIKLHPDTKYARDSKLKRDLVLDHLAGKEIEIGRYYLTRNHVNAGINRFRSVVKDYQTTTHVPEALHRLVESYVILGLTEEAEQVAAVLGHNYPGSKWYERSYKLMDEKSRQKLIDGQSFVDKTVESLFKPN